MKTPRHLLRLLPLLTLLLGLLVPAVVRADPPPEETVRTCMVKEVIKGGMYVYIRCEEGTKETWLATVELFKIDDMLNFKDVPPNLNFYSKQLNRTFPQIFLTEVWKVAEKKK